MAPSTLFFHIFLERFFFFPSLLKILQKTMHKYVQIIKYSNITEITEWKTNVSLHCPCPTPLSQQSAPTKKSSLFLFFKPYYPDLGQFHNNRRYIQSTGKFQNTNNQESLKVNLPVKYSPRKCQGNLWQSGWTQTRVPKWKGSRGQKHLGLLLPPPLASWMSLIIFVSPAVR